MLVKQPLADERIIDCLDADYGIKVVTLSFLPLGADMEASVYKAKTQDQLSYFIKLKRGRQHDISITVLKLLDNAKIQQIILPLRTIHNQLIECIDDFTLRVYPFIEGQNGFSHTLTDKQWLILGKSLRQVHEVEVPFAIQRRLRRETYSSKWREAVRSLYTHIGTAPIGDEVALKLLVFMQENIPAIRRLVDRAEQLAKILQHKALEFVLCHADIHGGNILIGKDNAIYIVDWDDPIMAPRERDLMFIGGGVGNVWNKQDEEALFYKGYGEIKVNMEILAYYRHERIVEDIALFGQNLLLTMTGGNDRAEMYKHFIAMFEPKGVVDIAFRTDESL